MMICYISFLCNLLKYANMIATININTTGVKLIVILDGKLSFLIISANCI